MGKICSPFHDDGNLALAVCIVASNFSAAKEKKSTLPAYVLQAQTAFVMIDPDEAIPAVTGREQNGARGCGEGVDDWVDLAGDGDERCGLVIVVRKGDKQAMTPTGGEPPNDRPVIVQGTNDTIRIGAQQGRSPDAAENGGPLAPGRGMGGEIGPTEDLFSVYQGRVEAAVDEAPGRRYAASTGLKSPDVLAVKESGRRLWMKL